MLLGKVLNNDSLGEKTLSHFWSMGYGAISLKTGITPLTGSLTKVILVANLPQVILSFLYLTYNSLFTCMLVAKEWTGFAHQRKTLRVTCPVGTQRSTYWLQLPYTYGIALLVTSATLHWLVSQSILLQLFEITHTEENSFKTLSSCGYSPIAIITAIPLGSILVLIVLLNGCRRYKSNMPLAGSCNAAISAACHRPQGDTEAAVLPLLWGAVSSENRIGHRFFTSFEVSPPVEGMAYANGFGSKLWHYGGAEE